MCRPEYLYYYIIGVYPGETSPIFQVCKDNVFVSSGKYLCENGGDVGKNDDGKRDSEKINVFIVINIITI